MTNVKLRKDCKVIRHLFWEFYGLNYLWFKVAGGQEAYGYKRTDFYPERLVEKINFEFEAVADVFFEKIKEALEYSIRSEMKYLFKSNSFFSEERIVSTLVSRKLLSLFLLLQTTKRR